MNSCRLNQDYAGYYIGFYSHFYTVMGDRGKTQPEINSQELSKNKRIKMPVIPRQLYQAAFIVFLFIISIFAFLPQSEAPDGTGWDKANHLLAFFVLQALFYQSWPQVRLFYCAVGLVIYGVLIELVQGQLPDRDASWLDIVANTSGIAIYLVIFKLFAPKKP